MIPFTQYHMSEKFGTARTTDELIARDPEIEAMAQAFIKSGGWFESEVLSNGRVSLTACRTIDKEPQDILCEITSNGPGVLLAVDRLVRKTVNHLEET